MSLFEKRQIEENDGATFEWVQFVKIKTVHDKLKSFCVRLNTSSTSVKKGPRRGKKTRETKTKMLKPATRIGFCRSAALTFCVSFVTQRLCLCQRLPDFPAMLETTTVDFSSRN